MLWKLKNCFPFMQLVSKMHFKELKEFMQLCPIMDMSLSLMCEREKNVTYLNKGLQLSLGSSKPMFYPDQC